MFFFFLFFKCSSSFCFLNHQHKRSHTFQLESRVKSYHLWMFVEKANKPHSYVSTWIKSIIKSSMDVYWKSKETHMCFWLIFPFFWNQELDWELLKSLCLRLLGRVRALCAISFEEISYHIHVGFVLKRLTLMNMVLNMSCWWICVFKFVDFSRKKRRKRQKVRRHLVV